MMEPSRRTEYGHGAGTLQSMSLGELLDIMRRRWRWIALIALMVSGCVLGFALTRPPGFRAEARLVLEEGSPTGGVLGELSILSQAPPAAAEIEVLRSRRLAESVVLPLGESDFAPEAGRNLADRVEDLDRYWPFQAIMRRVQGLDPPTGSLKVKILEWPADKLEESLKLDFLAAKKVRIRQNHWLGDEQSFDLRPGEPVRFQGAVMRLETDGDLSGRSFQISRITRRKAVEGMLDRLQVVETKRGSGVLRIAYTDKDPVRAANTLNALCSAYIAHNQGRLSRRAGSTVTFVESEIDRIKEELERAETDLVDFQEESGAVAISETAQAYIEGMSELELERARLGLKLHNLEYLLQLLQKESTPVEDIAAAAELDPLIGSMLESLAGLLLEQATLEETYTEKWQPLVELKAQVAGLRQRIRTNLQARLEGMQDQDESLAEVISAQRQDLEKLPKTEREMARFLRQAESYEAIYTFLLAQLQEAKIAEAAALAAVEVIDWAVPPLTRFKPSISLHLLIGLSLGMFCGVGLVLGRQSSVRKIFRATQLERATGLAVIGSIPDFRHGRARSKGVKGKFILPLRDAPASPAAEAYLSMRAYLRHGNRVSEVKTMAITAAGPGEGKSVTTANLAMALAKGGHRVLLVDTDMRKPMVHRFFQQNPAPGLSEILQGKISWGEALRISAMENLELICAGASIADPGDLLARKVMAELVSDLAEHFDYVLFDVPPVLAVADAAGFLAELDGLFLLCRADRAPEEAVVGAARRLEMAGGNLMGAIFNGFRPSRFSGGYGVYGYGYGYGKDYRQAEAAVVESTVEPPLGT